MKKFLAFLTIITLLHFLNSCSSDDDTNSKSVSFKVDGVIKNFKVTSAESNGVLFVTGYIGTPSDPTEYVAFAINSGATGANAITNFSYENTTHSYDPISFTSNVIENSGGKAEGTFSGSLESFNSGANISITEGFFSTK